MERKNESEVVPTKDAFEKFFKIKGTYTIREGVYDVDGDVLLLRDVESFPFKFGVVTGDFDCGNNDLISLNGAPKEVGGDFWCSGNNLVSLEGAPVEVGGCFWCDDNKLTSLEGAPIKVGGSFDCSFNKLVSLKGAPKEVERSFWCKDNTKSFTIEEVKTVSSIEKNIYINN